MKEEIKAFLNNETYILAYRSNYDSAREVNQMLIDYVKDLQFRLKGIQEERDYLFNKLSIENKSLQSQLKAKEEAENTFKEWIATEQFRLARSVSHTYKDSLNKTHLVNEDIFDELAIVLDKYNKILSKGENK